MNRLNSYLPSQGKNTHPVLPRENAQAHPIGINAPSDLTWPPQYADALNTEAQPEHALPPSISDYTLESPEDVLLYPKNIQSQPYHKRLIHFQTLLDSLETFYNNLGQPGSALKHHLTNAKSIRENLTPTDLLSRETRMAICATAHRVINMLVDPTLDTPTPETLSRFINQSCVFTINTDSPTKLLMLLVEHLSARTTSATTPATTLTTTQRPDQQSHPPEVTPPETQERSIEHCFQSIANALKVLLSRFSGVEPHAQNLQTAEQDMTQWLNTLTCLQAARNNLARYDDHTFAQEKKLIECYIPVIKGAIVRLEFFITAEKYTLTQSEIYRDLGDERKTAGAISATVPTHLPLLLNGRFSRCDNRDETASVNRLTQSTASIGLGGKLGPLQLSAGITGTRLHWYIYNTVKDFARALAEQDIDKRIKARIKTHFHDRSPTYSATQIDEPSPLSNPSRYLQQCRIQKQDQWSQQLEQLLMAKDPRAQTHPGDYLVKHIQPTDSNYMSLTQHFIGFAKGTSALGGSITGDISRSSDHTTVYTPYYELFENHPALLDDPTYIYSEKNPTLWQTLTQSFAEHNLTNAFEMLERSLKQPAEENQNVALTKTKSEPKAQSEFQFKVQAKVQAKAETPINTAENAPATPHFDRPRFDRQTTIKLKNILFSGFLKIKNMTDRLQVQQECGTLPPEDKKRLGHHWRQLQAECARLKRYYQHITTLDTPCVPRPHEQISPAALDPHIIYIKDLERYMMQPRFKMDPRDYTASFFATEIAQGHTTNYLNTSIEIPLVIPHTPLTITPTFTVSRYHIQNCGIPNLDGHYCDFSFSVIGSLTSEQLSDIMPVCTQRIIHQLSDLQPLHSGVTQALAQHLQSALSQHHSLDLTGATGIRFFWRFNPTQVIPNTENLNQHNGASHPTTHTTSHQKSDQTSHQDWHLQYHFISCQLAGGLDTQAPLNPLTHLSPINASVTHTQESGRRISLGDNTLKHIYRRFHSPYGFNKFWAWWQFLVDFRQQMTPLLCNLHRKDSNIRRELDQLCDAIRNGIMQKGENCQVTEAVLDTRIETLIAALKDFNDDDSTEHYQRVTLALTNLLALDFEVLYFDRLLASYTLNLPADARKETIIRG